MWQKYIKKEKKIRNIILLTNEQDKVFKRFKENVKFRSV